VPEDLAREVLCFKQSRRRKLKGGKLLTEFQTRRLEKVSKCQQTLAVITMLRLSDQFCSKKNNVMTVDLDGCSMGKIHSHEE
jgi:hypothetical protein